MGKAKEGNNIEYGVYTSDGQQFIPCRLTRAYFTTSAGINTYKMEFQGNKKWI